MSSLKQQVADYLSKNPNAMTLEIAMHLQHPEGAVLCALPDSFVRIFSAQRAEEILTEISQWGMFTTIIEKEGCIFEIKDRFPMGILARGYYNLNIQDRDSTFHGHLKLDNIAKIAFVSLPFRGKQSYNIAFIAHNGQTIFKVYLGRDENNELFPDQVDKFNAFQ